jgi:hypothetical protein
LFNRKTDGSAINALKAAIDRAEEELERLNSSQGEAA